MAVLLKRGGHFITGNGSAPGLENTIQSFNGDLYKYNQSFYVNIVSPDHIRQASAAAVTGANQFFISAGTNVTNRQLITVTLPQATFVNDEIEVGDTLGLSDSTHTDIAVYNFTITEVNYTEGDARGTVVARLNDPHPSSITVSAHITEASITAVQSLSATTFYFQIGVGSAYDELGRLTGGDHFQELDLDSDTGTDIEIYNGGVANTLGGSTITNGYYDFGRKIVEFWFGTEAAANAARAALVAELPGNLILETQLDVINFDRLGTVKPLHIGSKNTNSSTIVTPITLPPMVTIEAGVGVEDIFLIALNQ